MHTSILLGAILAALSLLMTIYGLAIRSKAVWIPGVCFLIVSALILWATIAGEGFLVPIGQSYLL